MSSTKKVTTVCTGCGGSKQTVTTVTTSSGSTSSYSSTTREQPASTTKTTKPSPKTVTPAAQSASKSSGSSFEQAVLDEHNRLRARHSAQPLKLNPAISRYAQEWANNIASRNTLQHRSNNKYGENLYASYGRANVSGEEVVRAWYNEIKYYRFGQPNPGNFSQVGHFTQVVWKQSRELGVGIARNGNNVYVACNYDPPGNFQGRYAGNVTAS